MRETGEWGRFGMPLCLSLAGHALLLIVFLGAGQGGPRPVRLTGEGTGPALRLHVDLVQRAAGPRRAVDEPALPSKGAWLPAQVDAAVAPSPVLSPPGTPEVRGPEGSGCIAGAGAGTGLLAVGPQARRVVYLIDGSISMAQWGAFDRARAEVLASLERLSPGSSFQVFVYSRSAAPLVGRASEMLPASASSRAEVRAALELYAPAGTTHHVPAVRAALAYRPDLLFLLTDADDLGPGPAAELARLPTGATAIHVIELSAGGAEGQGALAQLAGRTGGSYRRVSPE